MKILYIAAECKPIAKTGGVGDVAGELPVVLHGMKLGNKKIEMTVVMPQYGIIDPKYVGKKKHSFKKFFRGESEEESHNVVVNHSAPLDGKVPVLLVENNRYFGSDYKDVYINSRIPFYDDSLRFSFFSDVCKDLIELEKPDIVHINDWPLGYLFGFMCMSPRDSPIRKITRVSTVHNVGYQGIRYAPNIQAWRMAEIGNAHPIGQYFIDPHRSWCSVNPLRLLLELSHRSNFVSPRSLAEACEPGNPDRYFQGGSGLEHTVQGMVSDGRLVGILNGFNYKFAPTDDNLKDTFEKKAAMKKDFSKRFANPDGFLVGFVGRAVEQKFKLLTEIVGGKTVLEHILDIPDVNVAILSTGEQNYESFIGNISTERFDGQQYYNQAIWSRRRKNYHATIDFDKELAKQISLGSDVFLVPSLYEPCGITQLEAMSNATPPVVRWTGGLANTVKAHTSPDGTGFGFGGEDVHDRDGVLWGLVNIVREARDMYFNEPSRFREIQSNAFRERYTWQVAAKKYIEMYEAAIEDPKLLI